MDRLLPDSRNTRRSWAWPVAISKAIVRSICLAICPTWRYHHLPCMAYLESMTLDIISIHRFTSASDLQVASSVVANALQPNRVLSGIK